MFKEIIAPAVAMTYAILKEYQATPIMDVKIVIIMCLIVFISVSS